MLRSWSVVLGSAFVLAACGDSGDAAPSISFCQRAADYLRFEGGLANSAGNPVQTESFVSAWVIRLDDLGREASGSGLDPAVVDDIQAVRAGVVELDQRLGVVDYDLLQLPLSDLEVPEADDASARLSEFIARECAGEAGIESIGTTQPTGPPPLSDDELSELVGDSDPEGDNADRLRQLLIEELQATGGLTETEATCLVDEADVDQLASLLLGEPLGPDGVTGLGAAVESCGIDLSQLAGP